MISSIAENEEVQFYWVVLTSDIETEEANEDDNKTVYHLS